MIARIARPLALLALIVPVAVAQHESPLVPGDAEASAQLATIVSSAREAGLPTDPILGKVRYGLVVVHAPPQRIVTAARAVATRLQVAHDALAPNPMPSEIANGADALEYGATTDQLRAVRLASAEQSVSTPLGVLAQLLASKVEPKRAAQIVTDLIRRHATAAQLVALGTDVNADVTSGANPTAALDTRLRGLTAVLAPAGASTGNGPTAASSVPKKP
jgi:hypothetical protein